jgi:hypothetical protein
MSRHGSRAAFALTLLALVLVAVPARAFADSAQPLIGPDQGPFGGMIDLQPGAINGQVTLEPGSVSLQGRLADPGVDGQLQVNVPGQFVGSGTVSNAELSYDLAVCGPGVTLMLSGTHGTNIHLAFQDTASNPGACSGAARTTAAAPLFMRELLVAAQSQPASSDSDAQTLLLNWLRRLFGVALLAILLVLLIPAMPRALAVATETPPWGRLGLGLAVALIMPLLGVLIFAIGLPIGLWWLGVILLALYPVLLLLSMSVSGLAFGSWLSRRLGRPGVPILVAFVVAMLVLTFLSLLPYIGPIVNILAVIFGLGTLVLAPRSKAPIVTEPVVSA